MKIDLYELTSKYGIRSSKPMRVIVKPFKDMHKDERCFIIGNGPSLSPGTGMFKTQYFREWLNLERKI